CNFGPVARRTWFLFAREVRFLGFVLGVAGVVGWDEGAFAGAFDERPAVVGLEVVVVFAQPVGVVDSRRVGLGPAGVVVDLEPLGAGAAERVALRRAPRERGLLRDGRGAAEAAGGGEVDPSGHAGRR